MKQLSNDCFFARVEDEIKSGRNVKFRIRGSSMLPLLRDGKDEVVLYPCRTEDLVKGAVVLFRYKGKHILHRIIGKDGDLYRMQGDGVRTFHEECGEEDIIGVVKCIVRPSGRKIETFSVSWRLQSFLWQKSGRLGKALLALRNRTRRFFRKR